MTTQASEIVYQYGVITTFFNGHTIQIY